MQKRDSQIESFQDVLEALFCLAAAVLKGGGCLVTWLPFTQEWLGSTADGEPDSIFPLEMHALSGEPDPHRVPIDNVALSSVQSRQESSYALLLDLYLSCLMLACLCPGCSTRQALHQWLQARGAYHGLQLHRLIAEERPDAACRAIAVFHKRVADRLIDRSFTSNPLPAAIHGSQQNPSHR